MTGRRVGLAVTEPTARLCQLLVGFAALYVLYLGKTRAALPRSISTNSPAPKPSRTETLHHDVDNEFRGKGVVAAEEDLRRIDELPEAAQPVAHKSTARCHFRAVVLLTHVHQSPQTLIFQNAEPIMTWLRPAWLQYPPTDGFRDLFLILGCRARLCCRSRDGSSPLQPTCTSKDLRLPPLPYPSWNLVVIMSPGNGSR